MEDQPRYLITNAGTAVPSLVGIGASLCVVSYFKNVRRTLG